MQEKCRAVRVFGQDGYDSFRKRIQVERYRLLETVQEDFTVL